VRREGGFHETGFALLTEPVGIAFDVDGGGVVQQAIEDGAGDDGIAKNFAPRPGTLGC